MLPEQRGLHDPVKLILSEEEVVALIHNSIRPNCVLPTLVKQKSERKGIENKRMKIF